MDAKRNEYRKSKTSFLQRFVDQNPDLNWNWNKLSDNPNIKMEYILSTDHPWHFWFVSDNPNIRAYHILQRPNENWDLSLAIRHVDYHDIIDYPELGWSVDDIPKIRSLKKENIANDYNYSNNWWFLSLNKNLDMNYYLNENKKHKWPWKLLSIHPSATIKYITEHLDLPWKWDAMHMNPNMTEKFIENNHHLKWNWEGLSRSKIVSIEFILKTSHFPWRPSCVSANPNLTLEKMLCFDSKYGWSYSAIASNPGIIPSAVIEALSSPNLNLKNIAMRIMEHDHVQLFENPSITEKFIEYMFRNYENFKSQFISKLSSNLLIYDDTVCDREISRCILSNILENKIGKDVADLTASYCFDIYKNIV